MSRTAKHSILTPKNRTRIRAVLSTLVVLALAASPIALTATSANAATGGLRIDKFVSNDGSPFAPAVTGVQPGHTFSYRITVGCDEAGCINAQMTDPLPLDWNGLTLTDVRFDPADPTQSNYTFTGCTVGATIAATAGSPCLLTVNYTQTLDDAGPGTVGIHDGNTVDAYIDITVPSTLAPDWAANHLVVPNTAVATADNSTTVQSTATARIDVPTTAAVHATKSWADSSVNYNPGGSDSFTIGATNTSNVPATSIVLTDAPGATDGATSLTASNPFTFVNFAGLGASALPAGADQVQVDLYYLSGGTWNWVTGTPAATATLPTIAGYDATKVGGVRVTYTSAASGAHITANGSAGTQVVNITQREKNRTTGDTLSSSTTTVNNTVAATVAVPTLTPVTDTAAAALTITPVTVTVQAGVTIDETQIPAGNAFDVKLTGKNTSTGPLSTLTLSTPDAAGHPFLSDTIAYDSATNVTWPTGAATAQFSWKYSDGSTGTAAPLTDGGTIPATAPPAGAWVTGFTVTYFGTENGDGIPTATIVAGTTAQINLHVVTSPDTVVAPSLSTNFTEYLKVDGTVNVISSDDPTHPTVVSASDIDSDSIAVYAPAISVSLAKSLSPNVVSPGSDVVAKLTATTSSVGYEVHPTSVTVDDFWGGTADSFWDAFRVRSIANTSIPAGATLDVYYTTSTGGTASWTALTTGETGTYSADLTATPGSADSITGIRFVFRDASGFSASTNVQPLLVFEASATKRSGGNTSVANAAASFYTNTGVATATGRATGATSDITSAPKSATAASGIQSYAGSGAGVIISGKSWASTPLYTQTGATDVTNLTWGVTTSGYSSVTVSDPGTNEAHPESTTFQAFDLNKIEGSTDPSFRWDSVTKIELFDSTGAGWTTVPAPGGSWMSGTDASRAFSGYTLTSTETKNTTGVRITVAETSADTTHRTAAASDPTTPAAGSGVVPTGAGRLFKLDWTLRDKLRVPTSTDWVIGSIDYNVSGDHGVVDNSVEVSAVRASDSTVFQQGAHAKVTLVDDVPNVGTSKSPTTATVVAPHPGDVLPGNYPTQNFTIETWNKSQERSSYLRSMDPMPCATDAACVTPANSHDADVYTGKTYDPATNPFEWFTLTKITFDTSSGIAVDPAASKVALWYADGHVDSTLTMTTAAALTPAQLTDVVGVSVVYQDTDPATDGGRLVINKHVKMTLATKLRPTKRSDASVDIVGPASITNHTLAQSFAPNVSNLTDSAVADSTITLSSGALAVAAVKSATPGTVLESAPTTPVLITLQGKDGGATASANSVTLTDVDDSTHTFWDQFALSSYDPSTVVLPAGADRVHVDVQTGSSTWIVGTTVASNPLINASVTDLSTVTGIRFVFSTASGDVFDNGIIPAGYTATAKFTAVLRSGATFPGSVKNIVTATATHPTLSPVSDTAEATITLGSGNFALSVEKEETANTTHLVEPGATVPWTLKFTNTGTGFLNITKLVDTLDPKLEWDGDLPTFTTTSSTLTVDPTLITATSSASTITFTWPAGQNRLEPGKSVTITFKNISLAPLSTGQIYNGFVVSTTQTLDSCLNTSGNGQGITTPATGTIDCGTRNYVMSQTGPLLYTQKYVNGDDETTPLVDGATNIKSASLTCTPRSGGFYRTNCAAYTAVGKPDTWRLYSVNTGTSNFDKLTIVDPLPIPGDRLLVTGNPRNSTWRPVLDLSSLVGDVTAPLGTTYTWEVTTAPSPCYGTGGSSAWGADPTCSTHPAASDWTPATSYTGAASLITGLRIVLDFTATTAGYLGHNGEVTVDYKTVNTPLASAGAVSTALSTTNQFAWNQTGATAALTGGGSISRSPAQAGVTIATGPLEISKAVTGDATYLAPASVTFDVACTVAGTSVDLGALASVTVPVGGSTIVPGIPLGAHCTVEEHGPLGTFNETARDSAQSVDILAAATGGSTPSAQKVSFTNTYTAGPAISLVKTGALATPGAGGLPHAGDLVDYTFVVKNTGNVPLTGVAITDPLAGVSAITFGTWPGTPGTLLAGQSVTATATYALKQSDIDAQGVDNSATVTGTPPTGPPVDSPSTVHVPLTATPSVVLLKTSAFAPGGQLRAGDTVIYTFSASNTGNVTIGELQIIDNMPGLTDPVFSNWPSTPGKLLPGETVTTTADYKMTQADVDAGSLSNHAIIVATPPFGPKITGGSSSTISIAPHPAVDLVKTAKFAPGATGVVGDDVIFSFLVTNTGNVTLTGLQIHDAKPGLQKIVYGKWPDKAGLLGPGESVTATANYALTSGDVLSGNVTNSASVSAVGLVNGLATKVQAVSSVKVLVPTGLAATGLQLMPPTAAMVVLLLVGSALVLVGRRRRHRSVG